LTINSGLLFQKYGLISTFSKKKSGFVSSFHGKFVILHLISAIVDTLCEYKSKNKYKNGKQRS